MSCIRFTIKKEKETSLRYGLWTIFNYHYVKTKNNIFTFDFIIKTNIQYYYLEEVTEWLESLGGISNTGAADRLTHLILGFFVDEYAWSCNARTSDESSVLLLFISHVCVLLTNRPFLSLRLLFTFAIDVVRQYYYLTCEKS